MSEKGPKSSTPKLRFPEFRKTPGWDRVRGDRLFDAINDRSEAGGLPILAITQEHGAIPRGLIDYHVSVTEKSIASYKVVQPGDFIISLRSFQGGIEYSEHLGICSPAYVILRRKSDGSDGYFRYLFKSDRFIHQLTRNIEGLRDGKMISYKQFSDQLIPTPGPAEQRKIAECFTSLDDVIAAQARKVQALKTHKRGLMQQLFPRDGQAVPPLRFPEFRDAPEWVVKPLEDVAPLQRGFDLPSTDLIEGDVPVVYSNGIRNYHTIGMATGPGLVTGRSGTIGKLHFIDHGSYWPHNTSLWVTDFRGHVPRFVYHLFSAIGLERFASGSGVPTLNRNDVHVFETRVPPSVDEQQQIVDCLASADADIADSSAKLDILKIHKAALMQQLLSCPSPD
jgi:type I restriction enzyme, S subunit